MAKVHVVSTRVENGNVIRSHEWFMAGVKAEDQMVRGCEHMSAGRNLGPWPATPKMSRADFNYLARVVGSCTSTATTAAPGGVPGMTLRYVAEHVASHLEDTIARFDRDPFVEAATR